MRRHAALLLLVAAVPQTATAADPTARLCERYSGLPKGFGPNHDGKRPAGMAWVPGGTFAMGSEEFYPEEAPVRTVSVEGFWIDRHEVTNAEFAAFVAATGYVTVAERGLDPQTHVGLPIEMLEPGGMVFEMPPAGKRRKDPGSWWRYVPGADWRHPAGPGTSIEGRDNEPVVQIAWADARAYADWLGRDLPAEAEWERAARGGLDGAPYSWGTEPSPDGEPGANAWQGVFPVMDEARDGFHGTAPVGCFAPNGYGLFDMTGNVWEWSSDAWRPSHADPLPDPNAPRPAPVDTDLFAAKVIKGGSWLCSDDYCGRYRPAARQPHEVDLGSSHVGFRTVLRAPGPGPAQ